MNASYSCDVCSKVYKYKTRYLQHLQNHVHKKPKQKYNRQKKKAIPLQTNNLGQQASVQNLPHSLQMQHLLYLYNNYNPSIMYNQFQQTPEQQQNNNSHTLNNTENLNYTTTDSVNKNTNQGTNIKTHEDRSHDNWIYLPERTDYQNNELNTLNNMEHIATNSVNKTTNGETNMVTDILGSHDNSICTPEQTNYQSTKDDQLSNSSFNTKFFPLERNSTNSVTVTTTDIGLNLFNNRHETPDINSTALSNKQGTGIKQNTNPTTNITTDIDLNLSNNRQESRDINSSALGEKQTNATPNIITDIGSNLFNNRQESLDLNSTVLSDKQEAGTKQNTKTNLSNNRDESLALNSIVFNDKHQAEPPSNDLCHRKRIKQFLNDFANKISPEHLLMISKFQLMLEENVENGDEDLEEHDNGGHFVYCLGYFSSSQDDSKNCHCLATAVLLVISLLSGLSALYANEMKLCMQPLFNKAFHNIWGLLTFSMAMLSMYTAYETEIFFQHSLDAANYKDFKWLIQGCIIIIWLLTSYGPLWCLIYTKLYRSC